jgi:NTP pyrophosphatase (non-canonical NTP hydrolase)
MLTKKLYDQSATKYLSKIVEELNELAVAITHYNDGKIDRVGVLIEVADVLFQIEKIIDLLSGFNSSERRLIETFIEARISAVKKKLE